MMLGVQLTLAEVCGPMYVVVRVMRGRTRGFPIGTSSAYSMRKYKTFRCHPGKDYDAMDLEHASSESTTSS